MLSRKQQWRKICGRSGRRKYGGGGDGHGDGRGHTPASCTQDHSSRSSSGTFEEQLPPICATSTLATAVGAKQHASQPSSTRSLAEDSLCSSTTSASSSSSSINNNNRGDEDDGRTTRSVSFEQRTRVILVPTRHELKERVCEHEEDDQPQPGTRGEGGGGEGGDGDGGGGGGGGDDNNGIWWTMQECYGFRMAYRRQIYALGLKACRTLLCPASTVFLAGAAEEQEEEEEEARRDTDLAIAAEAATATAATAATPAAAVGGCYVPAAGEVLSPPPSPPCLPQEVVVG